MSNKIQPISELPLPPPIGKRNLTLACSVTESHLKEFLLLKFSAELFHECEWFISCDDFCFNYLEMNYDNCRCANLDLQNGKVFGNEEEISNFYGVIDGKFRAVEAAIKARGECLLVDSDIIFCGEFEGASPDVDASICPHYQWDLSMDRAWGIYNVGFVYIRSLEFLKAWEEETKSGNYQFEQVPIQVVAHSGKFRCQQFSISHNMGWWRFNSEEKKFRILSFNIWNDAVTYDGSFVSSFHFHSFVPCHHSKPFKKFVFNDLLSRTQSGNKIISEYNRLLLWSAH